MTEDLMIVSVVDLDLTNLTLTFTMLLCYTQAPNILIIYQFFLGYLLLTNKSKILQSYI